MSDSFVTPWTVARQAPLSVGFSRQEYWSGLPFPPPGDHPDPGIEHTSPALAGRFFISEPPVTPKSEFVSIFCICFHWLSAILLGSSLRLTGRERARVRSARSRKEKPPRGR